MKKVLSGFICLLLIFSLSTTFFADAITQDSLSEYLYGIDEGDIAVLSDIAKPNLNISAKSAVLMEASTGTVLYENNKDEKLPPASVTKVMTMLLIMEELDSGRLTLEDTVSASEHAVSMGGTQIYLEVGETMTVNDLFKSLCVSSANDAAVALAEHIAGSESEFVRRINERAAQLGMTNSNFTNCTGLFDDDDHYTTAYDLALATAELLKHPKIHEFTTIWMDTVRDGMFGLANTNKMMRTYQGMNGMKTGYTQLARHCLSGTATRDGMTLIAVVLSAPSGKERFADVATMLDYGFATFATVSAAPEVPESIKVVKGKLPTVGIEVTEGLSTVVLKGKEKTLDINIELVEKLNAPIQKGTPVGVVSYKINGETVKTANIVTSEDVGEASFLDWAARILGKIVMKTE